MKTYSSEKLKLSGINESLDPTRVFKHEINMTRSEIAEDVSNVLNVDIGSNDRRLTDDFCEKWVKLDLLFVKETTDDEVRQKKDNYMLTMLDSFEFETPKSTKQVDLLPDEVSTQDV